MNLVESSIKIVTVKTQELYKNYIGTCADIFWDNRQSDGPGPANFMDNLKTLATEDIDGIRKMFKEGGYTVLLLTPPTISTFEDEKNDNIQLHIFNENGNRIGIIGKSEMDW